MLSSEFEIDELDTDELKKICSGIFDANGQRKCMTIFFFLA